MTINQCSLSKSTSRAQVFKTVKVSIDFIQRVKNRSLSNFILFLYCSDLFSFLIYSLSKKKELNCGSGIGDYLCKDFKNRKYTTKVGQDNVN